MTAPVQRTGPSAPPSDITASPLGRPVQVAYATDDVATAAARFADATGAGPFFVVEHIALERARVYGVPGSFDHSSAYGQWGELMVELVHEHSPAIVEARSAVHHMAFMVADLAGALAWCADQGWPEVLLARTVGGQDFAFCDARHDLGHLVEVYEPSQRLLGFYEMVAAAARQRDGGPVVRRLG